PARAAAPLAAEAVDDDGEPQNSEADGHAGDGCGGVSRVTDGEGCRGTGDDCQPDRNQGEHRVGAGSALLLNGDTVAFCTLFLAQAPLLGRPLLRELPLA